MKFFSLDSPIIRFLSWITDLILLNLLWILYSLPVVTMGASTAALYTVAYKLNTDSCSGLFKTFHKAFRENFKKATPIFFLLLAAAVVLVFLELQFLPIAAKTSVLFYVAYLIPFVLFMMSASMVFPLIARFENTIFGTLRNAFLIAIGHFPTALLMAIVHLIPVILLFVSPTILLATGIVWVFAGASFTACLNSLLAGKVLKKFLPSEENQVVNENS